MVVRVSAGLRRASAAPCMRRVAQRTSPIWNFLVKSMPSPARSLVAPRRSSCSSKGLRSLGPHPWTSPICPAKHFSIASRLPEHVEIPMPKLVPSMTSGRLVEWFVSPGDPLCAGDLLCEVQVTGLLEEAPEADTSLLIESHEVHPTSFRRVSSLRYRNVLSFPPGRVFREGACACRRQRSRRSPNRSVLLAIAPAFLDFLRPFLPQSLVSAFVEAASMIGSFVVSRDTLDRTDR